MAVKLLTEHHLEFLTLKGGYTGSSESTLVKMPHCWKSNVMAHIILLVLPCSSIQKWAWIFSMFYDGPRCDKKNNNLSLARPKPVSTATDTS